ncbi:MAG TPA: uroporphyrinogen-III C-methyltransferase [Terriglobia bacterium]|nr:uroporphyrinogen-III C-methyltransferase [Terriglobia bacterium]
MPGKVHIVGAGPGDPDLLTLRALRALEAADVVLHDDLVPPEILALAPSSAAIFNVGKRCGQKSTSQAEINALLVAYAGAGFQVVRLHGGDPSIFGRVGEEIRALREAAVDFEIVPGVTAPLAAAAEARIPLTERHVASSVLFLTGHHAAGEVGQDAGSAARPGWPGSIPPHTTVVVYMPGEDYTRLADDLARAGLAPDTPCLIVSSASTARAQTFLTALASLAEAPRLLSPKVLIVGAVAASASSRSEDAASIPASVQAD